MAFDKMTIVQVLPEMEEGGVEGETFDQAVYIARKGHNSVVISGGGRMVGALEKAGCRHICWPGLGDKSPQCLKYVSQFRKLFLSEKIDILHLRSRLPAWVAYFAWKSLPIETRPSLVTTFHGFYSVNNYSKIMTKGENVIAVSNTIREHILNNYDTHPEKIHLIYGGYDVDQFDPDTVDESRVKALKRAWGIQGCSDPVIILPGRLTWWKGQSEFIDSLAIIKDIPFKALCVGELDEKQSYTKKLREKISKYNLTDKIKLVGHCNDMPAAMLAGDIIVSASMSQPEAFGKIAIEAMAMGRPVVATAHGGSLETVVDNGTGWLVSPHDVKEMAETLRKALGDPDLRQKFGIAGLKRASENFTAELMCEKNLALYRTMLEKRNDRLQNKSFRVLQLLPELEGGGVERGTLEMGKYLSKNGHTSMVVSGGGRLVQQLEREGSRHVTMKIGEKSPACLTSLIPLRRLIKREGINVLHLRSRLPAWIGYVVWLSIPKKDRPLLVTTFHGFYSVNGYSAIMTKGDAVIAVSGSIQQHIAECYGEHIPVTPILRGVDGEIFDPEKVTEHRVTDLASEWGIDTSKKIIMLPGRLTRLKGHDVFIKSLALLKNKNFQAVIVGDYEENPGYSNELTDLLAMKKLENAVRIVGHCSDMPAAYMLADIVVSASSNEPEAFGRVSIEAMAMGKPIIATAHGGSLETVTDGITGWLVAPSDPLELSKAIDNALEQSGVELKKIGANGRKRVLEKYTTQSMCDQTIALYRSCLDRKAASA